MAGKSAVIGSLDLVVKAKVTDLEKGLKAAEQRLKDFEKQASGVGASLKNIFETAAGVFAGTAILDGIKALGSGLTGLASKAIEFGKSQFETLNSSIMLAESLGLSVNSLESLRLAAKNVDVEFATVEKAFTKVAELIDTGLSDPDSPAVKTLDRLGLSAKLLAELPLDQQLRAIIDSINALPTQDRLAAASDVFGGKKALEILKLTGAVIDDASVKAKRWGLLIGPETVARVKELDDALDDLSAMFEGIGRSVFVGLLEPLKSAFAWIRDSIEQIGIKNIAIEIVKWIEWAANKILEAVETIINAVGGAKGALLQISKALLESKANSLAAGQLGNFFTGNRSQARRDMAEATQVELQLSNIKADIANLSKTGIKLPRLTLSADLQKNFDTATGPAAGGMSDKQKADNAAAVAAVKLAKEQKKLDLEAWKT